jgi:hypothetical protein
MAASEIAETLAADESLRLADFARACKAATRVVALYPSTHPALTIALTRVAEAAARLRRPGGTTLAVLPEGVHVDGRASSKPDRAIGELASLLHSHLIGELRVVGDLDTPQWLRFLRLLARSPEDVRANGGIVREWAAGGGGPIELRQIDYAEVLRHRATGGEGNWEQIVANYLEGDLSDLNDEALAALYEVAQDHQRFASFTEQLVAKAADNGRREQHAIVVRVLQALANFVAEHHPDELDGLLHGVAAVTPRLTPDILLSLLSPQGDGTAGVNLAAEVSARLAQHTVAEFVAQSVTRDRCATERLVEVFQMLVPDAATRDDIVQLAQAEIAHQSHGDETAFQRMWAEAAEMLTSYSDDRFVSAAYGRELAAARTNACDLERVSDDPRERIMAWRQTVSEDAVRRLEHRVILDLLAIETRAEVWPQVLDAAVAAIDQLVLTERIALAQQLLEALVTANEMRVFAEQTSAALDRLRRGELMQHVITCIRQDAPEDVDQISLFCRTLGPGVIGQLAEALAREQGGAVKRLRDVVLSFGAAGRAYAGGLRTSPNAGARRTAVDILRAFGGAEALPDLASLLDDSEPAVQRGALRAIVQIGTGEAYSILRQALTSSTTATRDALMKALVATRDEGAGPLFAYILEHTDHRTGMEVVHLAAIHALGKVRGDETSVEALVRVLFRSEWWAPRRTQRFRSAAAVALRAIGSPDAQHALERAAARGSRGVRRAARAALSGSNAPITAGGHG